MTTGKSTAAVVPSPEGKAIEGKSLPRQTIEAELPDADVIHMHARLERQGALIGNSRAIQSPLV